MADQSTAARAADDCLATLAVVAIPGSVARGSNRAGDAVLVHLPMDMFPGVAVVVFSFPPADSAETLTSL